MLVLRSILASVILMVGTAVLPGQDSSEEQTHSELLEQLDEYKPRFQKRIPPPSYGLRMGDVLVLTFPFLEEFNQTVSVLPDGYVALRGIDPVWVAGMTIKDASQAIRDGYLKILKDPVVTIEIEKFELPYFVAHGEFTQPGKYDLRGPTTVAEGVAIAGGLTRQAHHSQVLLFRKASDRWTEVREVNLKKMMSRKNLTEDLYLRPGDMLFVSRKFISKVTEMIPNVGLGLGIGY